MPGASLDPMADRKIWKGWNFVLQGNLKASDGKFMDHKAIAKLIHIHGGEVQTFVTPKTKVLVTTIDQVVRVRPRNVVKALANGRGITRIVSFDYIVDSVMRARGRVLPQSLKHHSIEEILKRLQRHRERLAIYKDNYYKEVKAGDKLIDSRLYHLYKDSTNFVYKVVLTHEFDRPKVDKRGRERVVPEGAVEKKWVEKYTLMLFESNAAPLTYKVGAKYFKTGQKLVHYLEYIADGDYSTKFKEFKYFFQQKTGVPWDKRLNGIVVKSLEKASKHGLSKDEGQTEAEDKPVFIYTPPPHDQPRGEMHKGWKDKVQLALEKEEKKRAIRLKKAEEARKREIEEEERAEKQREEELELLEKMAKEDEEVSQDSDVGWNSPGQSSDDDSD